MNDQGRAGMKMARIAFWNFALGNNTKLSNLAKAALDEAEKEITALREALNTRSSSTHSDAEYSQVAQPQELILTKEPKMNVNADYWCEGCTPEDCSGCKLPHLNNEAQPQGEWVDLTDDEKYDLNEEYHNSDGKPIKRGYDDAVIAKFKEKNTPPLVPQGELVGCMVKGRLLSYKDNGIPNDCLLYLAPPVVAPDHIRDTTKKVETPKLRRAGSFGD